MYFKTLKIMLLMSFVIFLQSCNKGKTKEEMEELWGKAQTTGEIINRSGTIFSSANDKDLAMRDAKTRLQTGGGLFGKKAGVNLLNLYGENENTTASVGLPINPYFWKASLDTVDFMPLSSADPFAGIIITDWHSANNVNERCKLNIFIKGKEMKTDNLKVNSFCQKLVNNNWVDQSTNEENNVKIENAILNKAKKLKLSQG